jgi:hypothetical protein
VGYVRRLNVPTPWRADPVPVKSLIIQPRLQLYQYYDDVFSDT